MKRKLIIVLSVVVLLLVISGSFAYYGTYSEGFRVGHLLKVSRKGFVFKTYEGQMGFGRSANVNKGNVFSFSVESSNTDVIAALDEAAEKNHNVKLYYVERFFRFPWRGDSKYFVVKVEPVN